MSWHVAAAKLWWHLWNMDIISTKHDDVIKWKHFPRYWPFVRGIHRSPVNSPHKGQWRGAVMFFFICVWINGWVNNREAGDLRRNRVHYDGSVMNEINDIWANSVNKYPQRKYQLTELKTPLGNIVNFIRSYFVENDMMWKCMKVLWCSRW